MTVALLRHGPLETVRLGAVAAHDAIGPALRLHETHVWYELDLSRISRGGPPNDLVVRRAAAGEVEVLREIPATGVRHARGLLARGGVLWLAFRDGEPAFSCWTWRARAPVRAARGGWLVLPSHVACLEDSVTAARFRGAGVAPASWAVVAGAVHADGARALVTKVGAENAASRRAVEKAGFRAVALMRTDRTWPRTRVRVTDAATPTATALARALEHSW